MVPVLTAEVLRKRRIKSDTHNAYWLVLWVCFWIKGFWLSTESTDYVDHHPNYSSESIYFVIIFSISKWKFIVQFSENIHTVNWNMTLCVWVCLINEKTCTYCLQGYQIRLAERHFNSSLFNRMNRDQWAFISKSSKHTNIQKFVLKSKAFRFWALFTAFLFLTLPPSSAFIYYNVYKNQMQIGIDTASHRKQRKRNDTTFGGRKSLH